MKNKTQRNIRICSYVALAFCVAWAVFYVFVFLGLLTGKGGVSRAAEWSQHTVLKIAFFVIDVLSLAATIYFCVKAALNFLKGAREGVIFPKSNVRLFFWLALAYFIHRLLWGFHPFYFESDILFSVGHSIIVIPFCILFFAFMYKVAADAVEENNLTI